MKKKYQRIIILFILITLLIIYLQNSNLVINSILEYTELFFTKLFPVSFLFFVFSNLLIDYGLIELISKTFHCNGSIFYVFFMSLVSGFPSGAKYTADLLNRNLISEKTANYLIKFTHFPNPLFILGSVNLILPDSTFTLKILFSLILSNIILGVFWNPKGKESISTKITPSLDFSTSLSKAIYTSVKVLLNIYGTSVFFYLIVASINHYLTLPPIQYVILNGLFDLTKGVFSTPLIANPMLQAILIIIFISFGGISIHMQVKSIIADTSIHYYNYLLGRIYQAILAVIFFILFIHL